MTKWTVEARPLDLELKERFAIATESWDVARNVLVTLGWGPHSGRGEVSPDVRWGDSQGSVIAQLEDLELGSLAGPFDIEGLDALAPPGPARCALDIAVHDLAAKLAGISVAELLGLAGRRPPPTSITLPIADPASMVARARAHADHPVIKMKVGFEGDVDAVAAVRHEYGGRLRLDANEGWSEEEATARLKALEPFRIELCEQPIPRGDLDALARVTSSTSMAVFADEDVGTAADTARLAGVVDGVNLKLRKSGGIREAMRAIAVARAHEMKVMIGCDLESGVAATAQATVAALCDFADVDGPLLLARDPYPGVRYERGAMTLPEGPGLGVTASP